MKQPPRITRRSLGLLLGSAAAGARPAQAQDASKPQSEAAEATEARQRNAEILARTVVPRDVEPAFRFQS